ncbi:hypothetical protein [uncultured Amnibacterium sp.]|uniref:hypothetical protein n=1 Tax=uncultured Amnibacterium sp. TaxID=1631851 RepID=UPI0035C94489
MSSTSRQARPAVPGSGNRPKRRRRRSTRAVPGSSSTTTTSAPMPSACSHAVAVSRAVRAGSPVAGSFAAVDGAADGVAEA